MEAKGSDTVSKESNNVLHLLQKASPTEGGIVYVDLKKEFLKELDNPSAPELQFPYPADQMISIFRKLSGDGYLRKYQSDWELLVLTHEGYHSKQTFLRDLGKFLLKSVVIPIIVSAITSIVVYHIEAYLDEKYALPQPVHQQETEQRTDN